jgi:hypothetical protein
VSMESIPSAWDRGILEPDRPLICVFGLALKNCLRDTRGVSLTDKGARERCVAFCGVASFPHKGIFQK